MKVRYKGSETRVFFTRTLFAVGGGALALGVGAGILLGRLSIGTSSASPEQVELVVEASSADEVGSQAVSPDDGPVNPKADLPALRTRQLELTRTVDLLETGIEWQLKIVQAGLEYDWELSYRVDELKQIAMAELEGKEHRNWDGDVLKPHNESERGLVEQMKGLWTAQKMLGEIEDQIAGLGEKP